MSVTRRHFLGLAALGASSMVREPQKTDSIQSRGVEMIPFTEEVAVQFAKNFTRSMAPESSWSISDIVPVLDIEGSFKGYYVSLLRDGSPSGYVSLNIDYPGLIAGYCLENGALGQAGRLLETGPALLDAKRVNKSHLIATGPFSFGLYDESSSKVANQTAIIDAPQSLARSLSEVTDWDGVLVDSSEIFEGDFTIISTKYSGELAFITQWMAMDGNKRYACGPHALYVIGASLPNDPQTAPIIPNATTDWTCYNKLWDYSGTRQTGTTSAGVALGNTESDRLGPAFVRLCSERNTTMKYSFKSNPSFASLCGHINNSEVAVIGAGIKTTSGNSGHYLATNGYAYLFKEGQNKQLLQCAAVFDGWDQHQFFNFDFPNYYFKDITFLYRKK